jgi:hypothetical protein
MVLILALITCGLYGLVWLWQAETEMKEELGQADQNPGLDVLLTILTLGIWFLVVIYRLAKQVAEAQQRVNVPPNDLSLVALLVSVLGFWFVAITLLQVELNKIWAARSGAPVSLP